MNVRWTVGAVRQLRSIEAYLRRHDAAACLRIGGRLERAAQRLGAMPRLGRPAGDRDARLLKVAGTRYIIGYALRGDEVTILALFHERQQRPSSFLSD